jgi:hypothetical protein
MKVQAVSILMLFTSSVSFLAHGQAGVMEEPCKGGVQCAISRIDIVERPQGRIDGINRSFVLTRSPAPGYPVQVHRNGLPLERGTDFEITDKALTIAKDLTPQVGDVLDAKYFPAPLSENSIGRASPPVLATGVGGTEIAIFAARRALQQEGEAIKALKFSGQISQSEPISIEMLTEKVARSKAGPSEKRNLSINLQGVDGLADANPFDSEGREKRTELPSTGDVPSFMVMLQRQVAQRDDDTPPRSRGKGPFATAQHRY